MHKMDAKMAACAFLLFLLFTPVSPVCRKGTPDECLKAEYVPGVPLSGSSIDITTLRLGNRWADVDQWKAPDGSCTLCENPVLKGTPLQKLPLIISNWEAHMPCQMESQSSETDSCISVAESLVQLRVENDWRKELDVKIRNRTKTELALAGSHSDQIKHCINSVKIDNYMIDLKDITCPFYKYHVGKNRLLSKNFQERVNNLPEKYNSSSKDEYHSIIRTFGTHFPSKLAVGMHSYYFIPIPLCLAMMEDLNVSKASRCLATDMGIALGLDGMTGSPDVQICEEMKKTNVYIRLHEMSKDMFSGGIILAIGNLEKSKTDPDLLSASLEPIHTLVDLNDTRREGLKEAVSEYVKERALWRDCSKPCPPGSQSKANDFCSCECPDNNFTNSRCCAAKPGVGKLAVTVHHAEGLWGDLFTRSDGYVSVIFEGRRLCTRTVWNNNNPTWNVKLDFGVIQLPKENCKLQVEVWDEDLGWNDDLLGKCTLNLDNMMQSVQSFSCYLKHGTLRLELHFVCGPKLGGICCSSYIHEWPKDNYYYEHDVSSHFVKKRYISTVMD